MMEAGAAVLVFASEAFIGQLIKNSADQFVKRLEGDPAKEAFKLALGRAIESYAKGARFEISGPLRQERGFLTDPTVAEELTYLLYAERKPNYGLIGDRWKAAIDSPPAYRDFAFEAELFGKFLQLELRRTDVFRPILQARDVNVIAEVIPDLSFSLTEIEGQIKSLIKLHNSAYGELLIQFFSTNYGIRDQIRDYTGYIEEKTRDFVGRQFVFDEIARFVGSNPRGYLFVRGDPGIGKSALAAEFVKNTGCVHHFNIRAEGISKASDFLTNVCAQLIAAYNLPFSVLPEKAGQDAGFLKEILSQVSAVLNGESCIIVVDALDEANYQGQAIGENILCLPRSLPKGVYVVATARNGPLGLVLDCEQDSLSIGQDDDRNNADIHTFIEQQLPRIGIQEYVAKQGLDDHRFGEHIARVSEGNFIYVRMVLDEIDKGAYASLEYTDLPVGLSMYYEDHWKRMRQKSDHDWFEWKLPVIAALTVVKEPVSIEKLVEFSFVDIAANSSLRVIEVLNEFSQFLYTTFVDYEGGRHRRYRWYHSSFFEFVSSRGEINLLAARQNIADRLWENRYD
jgi:hypothetical protein